MSLLAKIKENLEQQFQTIFDYMVDFSHNEEY
jgi:hypothetical protein